ncbi:hypothetical protein [Lacisediminimonas sp.]|uniref:hypothetical protein n=1 Tax=Lacisediminimonas sp. TaxID=3060582 RepID=UPI00271C7AC9|nr:hypothetical protein [Lacisediminimonas sp.]MDO8301080.1 hypothetical protein [Lacisediminimonas sp.]
MPTKWGGLARGAVSHRHAQFLRSKRLRQIWLVVAQVAVLVIFLGAWHFAVALRLVDPFIISQPGSIAAKLGEMLGDGSLMQHLKVTLAETLLSFAIGTIAGIIIAGIFWIAKIISGEETGDCA